jgi:TRAP-type C4-dicarboxylate transport system permease large subunit
MVVGYIIAKKRGYVGQARPPIRETVIIVLDAIPALLMLLICVGGIVVGVFTATEASCIAVVYALILSIAYKNITFGDFIDIVLDSAKTTGIIMFLIGASNIMGWVMSFTGLPDMIGQSLLGISQNKYVILLIE